MPFGGDECNDNSVMLTYTIKKGSIKIISENQDFNSLAGPDPCQRTISYSLYLKCPF